MKNTIIRRVTILMSTAIFISTILVVSLGVFLSEGLMADTRAKEFIPDLSVVTQLTIEYQDGNLDKNTYEKILMKASGDHTSKYFVLNSDKTVIFTTEDEIDKTVESKIHDSLIDVLDGDKVFYKLKVSLNDTVVLVGVPIIKEHENIGAVFILVDMEDLLIRRRRFYGALIISMIIVVPFVAGLSYIVLKRIVKPIKNVAKVALSMIQGDFSVRADETLEGEIGLMGKTINRISIDLYKNISQLFVEKNRLHQVLNSLEEGMIAVDENNMITHFNNVFLEMFSLKEETIKGKCLDDFSVLSEDLYELSQAIKSRNPIIKKGVHKDTIIRIIIAPIVNEKNDAVGAVIVFKNITELEKLEAMRRDYVANVSHELRSPLTSIRGLIEPLMDSIVTSEEDIKRYYKIIYQESLRLSRLVDDIMELSRLQTNEAIINKTYIDLSSIIEIVYERYKLLDEEINLVYNPSLLPMAYTNYDRVEQILVILLDNAYKFTQKGGKIEILTEVRDKDILVTVKDTGAGISNDDLPFVFDRFYKSDKSRTKKGTGLGLSIAKEILSIMGENIKVESVHGLGSAFEFTVHLK